MPFDFLKIVQKTFEGMGAPIRRIDFSQDTAIGKGDSLRGVGYCVPGKGQYTSEDSARAHMDEHDELYRIDIERLV